MDSEGLFKGLTERLKLAEQERDEAARALMKRKRPILNQIDLLIGPVCREFGEKLNWAVTRESSKEKPHLVYVLKPPDYPVPCSAYMVVDASDGNIIVLATIHLPGRKRVVIPQDRLTEAALESALETVASCILTWTPGTC